MTIPLTQPLKGAKGQEVPGTAGGESEREGFLGGADLEKREQRKG